jgi:hypothetical protein
LPQEVLLINPSCHLLTKYSNGIVFLFELSVLLTC